VEGFQVGSKVWETSPLLRVRGVAFDPQASVIKLEDLPFRTGDHLFGFSAQVLRKELLKKYPQLSSVRLSRSLRGVVTVHSSFRVPLGVVTQGQGRLAVDRTGAFFPVSTETVLPVLDEVASRDLDVLGFLEHLRQMNFRWSRGLAQVHETKTGLVQFKLKDETEVLWGFIEPLTAELKAKRLERVLFGPDLSHTGFEYAHFIDTDRIVVKKRL
jgi:cell division septal protein FtsQ